MRLPFQSSLSRLSHRLREIARNDPAEAEEFLDTHQEQWEEIAETDPGSAADILEALPEEDAADLLQDLDPTLQEEPAGDGTDDGDTDGEPSEGDDG